MYKLLYFFKYNKFLFNFNIYSFSFINFSLFNLYLPKLYFNRLTFNNLNKLNKKNFLNKFLNLLKFKHKTLLKNIYYLLIQHSKTVNLKVTNNKLFNYFFNEFLYSIFKKKVNCTFIDFIDLITVQNNFLIKLISKNLQLFSKLKLKLKSSFFLFLIISSWFSLLQKDSFFFTKFITYGLKTRTQKIFLRFLKRLIVTFFTKELLYVNVKSTNTLKGLQIGLFGKVFGRRRSTKLYLNYFKDNMMLTTLFFKKINFSFLKC